MKNKFQITYKKVVEIFYNQKHTRNPDKKKTVSHENFHEKKFEDFVTKESFKYFKK